MPISPRCPGRGPHQRRPARPVAPHRAAGQRWPGPTARPVDLDPVQSALRQRPEYARAAARNTAPSLNWLLALRHDGMDFIRHLLREAPPACPNTPCWCSKLATSVPISRLHPHTARVLAGHQCRRRPGVAHHLRCTARRCRRGGLRPALNSQISSPSSGPHAAGTAHRIHQAQTACPALVRRTRDNRPKVPYFMITSKRHSSPAAPKCCSTAPTPPSTRRACRPRRPQRCR